MAGIREPHAEVYFETPPEVFDDFTPELVTCIVARCNQVVEIQESDGSINTEAQATVPAVLVFESGSGTWLAEDDDALSLRVDNGILQTMTFKDTPGTGEFLTGTYTQEYLKDALERAFRGASAKIVGSTMVLLFSDTTGSNSKIEVVSQVDGNPTSPMFPELVDGMVFLGQSYYTNQKIVQRDEFLPDPRDLGEDKLVDPDTVRAFIRRNNVLVEFEDDSALMLAAKSVAVNGGYAPHNEASFSLAAVDDNDADSYTPWVASLPVQASVVFDQIRYTVLATASVTAGDTAIGSVGNAFSVYVHDSGGGGLVVTRSTDVIDIDLGGTTPDRDTLVASLTVDATFNVVMSAEVISGGSTVVSTMPVAWAPAGKACVGYDAHNWAAIDGGAATAKVVGDVDLTSGYDFSTAAKKLVVRLDGGRDVEIVLNQLFADAASIVTYLNGLVPDDDPFSSMALDINDDGSDETVLVVEYTPASGQTYGRDSSIKLGGTAVSLLFGSESTYATTFFGRPHSVDLRDEVWADGQLIGTVIGFEDYVSGDYSVVDGILVLDTEVSTSFSKTAWYIKANNLRVTDAATERPRAMMVVDETADEYIVKDNAVVDYAGQPIDTSNNLYIGYTALRKDLGDDIVVFEDLTELENELAPISLDNPFGLMMYLAFTESDGKQITGIAVKDFSETEPDGTESAYSAALDVLTSKNVNRLVCGSREQAVGELFDAHGIAMFDKSYSRGRLIYLAEPLPDEMPPTVLGSGNANSAGGVDAVVVFDSGQVVVEDAIRDGGVDPSSLTVADGVYVQVEGSRKRYVVQSVSGQQVTLQTTGFSLGENDDDYWSTDTFPAIVDQVGSLYLRGDALSDTDDEIEALGMLASHYEHDGTHFIQPDACAITLGGVDYRVDNRYLAAIVAGGSSRYRASRSLNGMQLREANAVYGSNDRYSQDQLNEAQGDGVFWIENYRGASQVRMQLTVTTERSNVFAAKAYLLDFWRIIFRDYFRMEEISSRLEELLSTKIEGAVRFLDRARICKKFEFKRIEQDPDDPRGLVGYADASLYQPFEKFTMAIKLI